MNYNWNDKEPIYIQLKTLAINMILAGEIQEGDALPSVRQTATDYQLNPITVSKAWQLLVTDGIVEKQRGMGMYVKKGAVAQLRNMEKEKFMAEDWEQILQKVKMLDISRTDLIASLNDI